MGGGKLEEQLLLRLEVGVEGAAGETGALADRLDAGALEADLGEEVRCGVEEARAGVLAAAGHGCCHDPLSLTLSPQKWGHHSQ